MSINIERLLRLTADYHNFCNDDYAKTNAYQDPDELSMSDLDLIAAATGELKKDLDQEKDCEKTIF